MIERTSKTAEPVWEIAYLFPEQGAWSEEDYLGLDTNHLIEFSDGNLEFLTMPTPVHQRLVAYLYRALLAFILTNRLQHEVLFAPLRIQLWKGKYREPDVVFMLEEHRNRKKAQYWIGADLVMKVISSGDPERDKTKKRQEYAQANIPEYWLVDPTSRQITVFTLQGNEYAVHGEFQEGQQASSVLLTGFEVEVTAVFEAANQ